LNPTLNKISTLRILINKNTQITEITDLHSSLSEFNFDEETDVLQFEKKGIKLTAEFCISFAYAGPIIIFLYFFLRNSEIFNLKLYLILILALTHYAKRIYETNFVHIYGKGEYDFFSMEYFGVTFYYWILFGFLIGYNTFDFNNAKSNEILDWTHLLAIKLHLLCEFNNYKSHMILRNLKINNSGNRGIPKGNMFEYVSNSHYFWELMSWICYFLFVRNWSTGLFVFFSFLSMSTLAIEKHNHMKNYFGDSFPKHLKAFIPFIL
jgi:very-long-chain enoyl-CoA reductase